MNSIKAKRPLSFPWQTQDPFLFCVHHLDFYPKGNEELGPDASLAGRHLGQDFTPNSSGWRMYHGKKVPGFPAHPHCGFETVTIVTQGFVDHSDSLGAAGRFGNGDVQWMTAGKGVQHCEMFPLLNSEKENTLELFQIWLNLPASKKSVAPFFSMIWSDKIPLLTLEDSEGRITSIKVIAGALGEVAAPKPAPDSWAADQDNEVAIWLITLEPGATWQLPAASKEINRSLFFFQGKSIVIGGETFDSHQAIELNASVPALMFNGSSTSSLLMLQGKPIGQPVVQYGPFVMNSQEQIRNVMSDFQRTQFGGWPWPSFEHVHTRDKKRFARYPDGTVEERVL